MSKKPIAISLAALISAATPQVGDAATLAAQSLTVQDTAQEWVIRGQASATKGMYAFSISRNHSINLEAENDPILDPVNGQFEIRVPKTYNGTPVVPTDISLVAKDTPNTNSLTQVKISDMVAYVPPAPVNPVATAPVTTASPVVGPTGNTTTAQTIPKLSKGEHSDTLYATLSTKKQEDMVVMKKGQPKQPSGSVRLVNRGTDNLIDSTVEDAAIVIAGEGEPTDSLWYLAKINPSTGKSAGSAVLKFNTDGKLVNKRTGDPIPLDPAYHWQLSGSKHLLDAFDGRVLIRNQDFEKYSKELNALIAAGSVLSGPTGTIDEVMSNALQDAGANKFYVLEQDKIGWNSNQSFQLMFKPYKLMKEQADANGPENRRIDMAENFLVTYEVDQAEWEKIKKKIQKDQRVSPFELELIAGMPLTFQGSVVDKSEMNGNVLVDKKEEQDMPFDLETRMRLGLPFDTRLLLDSRFDIDRAETKDYTNGKDGKTIEKRSRKAFKGDVGVDYALLGKTWVKVGAGYSGEFNKDSVERRSTTDNVRELLNGYFLSTNLDLGLVDAEVKHRSMSGSKQVKGSADELKKSETEVRAYTNELVKKGLDLMWKNQNPGLMRRFVDNMDLYAEYMRGTLTQSNALVEGKSYSTFELGMAYNLLDSMGLKMGYKKDKTHNSENGTATIKATYKFGK
ncbi:hypothetical protein ACFLZ7_00460 [Nanoarchaeota archaeon]